MRTALLSLFAAETILYRLLWLNKPARSPENNQPRDVEQTLALSRLRLRRRQRVAVARALANEPNLILADEPTAALDGQRGRQVMELFRKVAQERGAGVMVVTHDHRAPDVFDRVIEMEDGRLHPGHKTLLSA
jgi:ABC-type lipoprotein export system ATPase subunit